MALLARAPPHTVVETEIFGGPLSQDMLTVPTAFHLSAASGAIAIPATMARPPDAGATDTKPTYFANVSRTVPNERSTSVSRTYM